MTIYNDEELDAAVAAGALKPEAAQALRAFAGRHRAAPDEEQFRLLTGFNDIFISIAMVVFLTGAGWLAGRSSLFFGGAAITGFSWGLAEYFTRRRRLSLPSIVLALGYGLGCAMLFAALIAHAMKQADIFVLTNLWNAQFDLFAVSGFMTLAYVLHWRRFQVPITAAFMGLTGLASLLALARMFIPGLQYGQPLLHLLGGLALFALAMRWDMSDRQRATRRTDVAFWLHLAAAPLIVHALFHMLGVFSPGQNAYSRAGLVAGLYLLMTLLALIIDRRAILTAALLYVMYAISALIRTAGSPEVSLAAAGFVIGAALLLLSAFWNPTRKFTVRLLPARLQAILPVISERPKPV